MSELDITKTKDLVTALQRAIVMGERHGRKNKKLTGTEELREACGVDNWYGGNSSRYSEGLRALRAAYVAAWWNGYYEVKYGD